jgi:hypothetical protein
MFCVISREHQTLISSEEQEEKPACPWCYGYRCPTWGTPAADLLRLENNHLPRCAGKMPWCGAPSYSEVADF